MYSLKIFQGGKAPFLTLKKGAFPYFTIFLEIIYQKQVSDKQLFFGDVELDEAHFRAKRLRGINVPQKQGRGTWKQPVFSGFERVGRVYTEIVPNAKKQLCEK